MEVDYGIEPARERGRGRYNFDGIRPGASIHVADDAERCRVMAAFKYWARKTKKIGAYATSAKVGAEDPKGPGFRIWFKSRKDDAAKTAARCDNDI